MDEGLTAAQLLLKAHVTPEQWKGYQEHDGFWVTAASGKRYWVSGIKKKSTLLCRKDGTAVKSFGFFTNDADGERLPGADHLLAQKLMLEDPNTEKVFLQTACSRRLIEASGHATIGGRVLTWVKGIGTLLLIALGIAALVSIALSLLYGIGWLIYHVAPESWAPPFCCGTVPDMGDTIAAGFFGLFFGALAVAASIGVVVGLTYGAYRLGVNVSGESDE